MSDELLMFEENNDVNTFLEHHGILGMKWGRRNGPPYPLNAGDHSSAEKSAAKKAGIALGSYMANQQKKKAEKVEAAKKQAEEKEKDEIRKSIQEGDREKVSKNFSKMSNEELNEALNRIGLRDKIESSKMDAKTRKAQDFVNKSSVFKSAVSNVADIAEKGVKAYNVVASVSNSVLGTTLPKVDTSIPKPEKSDDSGKQNTGGGKTDNKRDPKIEKIIRTGDAETIQKHKTEMSNEEFKAALDRLDNEEKLKKRLSDDEEERKKKAQHSAIDEDDVNAFLEHHGIEGQKWGKRNGPPYPLSSDVSTGSKLKVDRTQSDAAIKTSKKRALKKATATGVAAGILMTPMAAYLGGPVAAVGVASAGVTFATNYMHARLKDRKTIKMIKAGEDALYKKKVNEVKPLSAEEREKRYKDYEVLENKFQNDLKEYEDAVKIKDPTKIANATVKLSNSWKYRDVSRMLRDIETNEADDFIREDLDAANRGEKFVKTFTEKYQYGKDYTVEYDSIEDDYKVRAKSLRAKHASKKSYASIN